MMHINQRYRILNRIEAVNVYLIGKNLLAVDRVSGRYAEIKSRFDLRFLDKIESGYWQYLNHIDL